MYRQLCTAIILVLTASIAMPQETNRTLLAIFAHPDDESTVSPILSRYAREGADVHLLIATDGRYGTNEFSGLEAGDGLAAVRRKELECAADALGVKLLHLDYHDQLRAAEGYDGHIPHVRALLKDVHEAINTIGPDAIITWGPDGGSNHLDHRLIGATVTGAYLNRTWDKPIALYYYGTPSQMIDNEEARLLRGVDLSYLTTVVSYAKEDLEAARLSAECHKSQFAPEYIEQMTEKMRVTGNRVYLRRFMPPSSAQDSVFE